MEAAALLPLLGGTSLTPCLTPPFVLQQMYCTGGIRCDVYSALLRQKVCASRRPHHAAAA
jgi:hypothetical protein